MDKSRLWALLYDEYNLSDVKKDKKPNEIIKKNIQNRLHYSDRVLCDICGKTYARSGLTSHNGTQYHLLHLKFKKA